MARELVFAGDQISKQPQALYEKMLRTICDKHDVDVTLTVCHGRYETMPAEMSFDKLYIFVQLLPKEFEGIKKSTIKGFKIGGDNIVFPSKEDKDNPSNQGPCPQSDCVVFSKAPARAVMIVDDNNVPMGAILDGALYIVNDFIHSRNKADFEVGMQEFEFIMKQAIEKGLIESVKSGLEEKSKRALEAALRKLNTERLDKELVVLKASQDTIVQYEKGITDATRKVISTAKIVEAIRANIADVDGALNKTWKALSKMSGSSAYENIAYTKLGIKALTTPVVIKYDKKEFDLGKFEVTLAYDGTCRIDSKNPRVDGKFDHPHINSGTVCWGNFAGAIPKLIGSSEFDVALDMIYTFLCHYDSGNPYKPMEYWPQIKKVVKAEVKQEVEVKF